jgi:uncharacterized protein (DUF3820 family)
MSTISKKELKDVVLIAIDVFKEISEERGIVFSSEDIAKLAISLFIQASKGNGGYSNGQSNNGNNGGGNGKDKDTTVVPINFGKYKGKTLLEVVKTDRNYVAWLAEKSTNEHLKAASRKLLTEIQNPQKKIVVPQPKMTH